MAGRLAASNDVHLMEPIGVETSVRPDKDCVEKDAAVDRHLKYKIIKQICLVLTWIAMGLYLEIVSPSLTDLKDQTSSNYEEVSRTLTARSIGYFTGAVIGGYVCDRFNKKLDLFIACGLLISALGTTGIPFFSHIAPMGFCTCLTGLGQGVINAGGNAMVLRLWNEQAPAPMQTLHFGFGFGAIIAPQIMRPFLSIKESHIVPSNWTNTSSTIVPLGLSPNRSSTEELPYYKVKDIIEISKGINFTGLGIPVTNITIVYRDSNLTVPFVLVAVYTTVIAALMLGFYLRQSPKALNLFRKSTGNFKIVSPATCAGGDLAFGCVILALLFVYYAHVGCLQKGYSRFLTAFAYESRLMTKDEATNLLSSFWVSFTCGRALGALVAYLVKPKYMIPLLATLSTACIFIIAIFGCTNIMVLWVANCAFALVQAPLFACGLSWCNVYLDTTSMVVCIFLIGSAVGGGAYQWAVGFLFEFYGTCSMMYLIAASGCVVIGTFVVMQLVANHKGERFERDNNDCNVEMSGDDNEYQLKQEMKRKA